MYSQQWQLCQSSATSGLGWRQDHGRCRQYWSKFNLLTRVSGETRRNVASCKSYVTQGTKNLCQRNAKEDESTYVTWDLDPFCRRIYSCVIVSCKTFVSFSRFCAKNETFNPGIIDN